SFECGQISDIAPHEPEVGMPVEANIAVAGVLCEVENRDGVSAAQQCGDQVRSDEAVAACHDDIGHECSFISTYRFTFAYRPMPLKTTRAARTAVGSNFFRPWGNPHLAATKPASRASGIWWNCRCPARTTKASASSTADSMSAVRGIFVTVRASSAAT